MPSTSLYPARRYAPVMRRTGPASSGGPVDVAEGDTLPAPLAATDTVAANTSSISGATYDHIGWQDAAWVCARERRWTEASWYVHHQGALLLRMPGQDCTADMLSDLASQAMRMARLMASDSEQDSAIPRRLAALARDLCCEAASRLSQIEDLGRRMVLLLGIAQVLENLGDRQDAEAMRDQAVVGLRSLCRPRAQRLTRIGADVRRRGAHLLSLLGV